MDLKYPNGVGASESDLIRYVQAQSASAFIGIQSHYKSQSSLETLNKTLRAHSDPSIVHKP